MRLSIDGRHHLGQVQGAYLDGRLVMPKATGWDFLSDAIIGWGGFDGPNPGLYVAALSNPVPRLLSTANVLTQRGLWTDGQSRWLTDHTDGARDSDGNHWPGRAAIGSTRQGDWVFVRLPDYTAVIVRAANGAERTCEIGQGFLTAWMDNGVLLVQPISGPMRVFNFGGGSPAAPVLPNAVPFVSVGPGQRWLVGYQPGWSLIFANWDETPYGWMISYAGPDFGAAIVRRDDGIIVVVSGANAGETVAHVYELDVVRGIWRVDGEAWQPKIVVNVTQPPTPEPPQVHVDPLPAILVGSYYAYTDRYYTTRPGDQDMPATGHCTFVLSTPDLPNEGRDAARRCPLPAIVDMPLVDVVKHPIAISKAGSTLEGLRAALQADATVRPELPRLGYLDRAYDDPNGWTSLATRPSWWPATAWVGVQLYADVTLPTEDEARDMLAALDKIRTTFGPTQNIQLVVEAFDRNHTATLAQVERLQPFWQVAVARSGALGLHFFAYARPGGMRDYPSLFDWFTAYAAAAPAKLPAWVPQPPQPHPPEPPHPSELLSLDLGGSELMNVPNWVHQPISIDCNAKQITPHPNSPGRFAWRKADGSWTSFNSKGEVYAHGKADSDCLDEQELIKVGPIPGGILYLADRSSNPNKKDETGELGYIFRIYAFTV